MKRRKRKKQDIQIDPRTASDIFIDRKRKKADLILDDTKSEEQDLLPSDFDNQINDKDTLPPKKANIIFKSTQDMIDRVFEQPTHGTITQFKRGVSRIVNLIIDDEDTAAYLISLLAHDPVTYHHSVKVGILSILLCKSFFGNYRDHDMHKLGAGFFLHDIGKINIDTSILNKEDDLTSQELKILLKHPLEGYRILADANQLDEETKVIVLQHHERTDGSGYPRGLKGSQIHMYAKICSIANVFDALTSYRPYRKKLSPYQALSLMKKEMLGHFQEDLFNQFVLLFK
jgi:HD-GYP domain-containing protein (c-di-GMP phosphodiesterase class II)